MACLRAARYDTVARASLNDGPPSLFFGLMWIVIL